MFRARLLFGPVLLLGLGCSVSAGRDAGDDAARGPLGKADNIGSCETPDGDACGGPSDGSCWCDDSCEFIGDCCADKQEVCDGAGPDECVIECELTCGSAFGCDCEQRCGVDPDEPVNEFCQSDDDCAEGDFCNTDLCVGSCPVCLDCNFVCMPKPEPEPEPDPDVLCLLQCQSTCFEISGDCGCHEKCGIEEPPPPTFCSSDDNCPGEQVCDTSICIPSCPVCADCNFVCVDP